MSLFELLHNDKIFDLFSWICGFLIALSVHEAAHATVANYLGDPTAKFAGRISLNPLKHLDPAGTLMLLFAGFGWGKPVPVNPANFANQREGEMLTSIAGPLSNFAVALVIALPLNFFLIQNAENFPLLLPFTMTVMKVNIIIMVFNLLPIPPLDGGGAVAAFLPPKLAEPYRRNGPIFLFGLIAFDWVFKTSILWGILGTLINIVFAAINLSTTFGG